MVDVLTTVTEEISFEICNQSFKIIIEIANCISYNMNT